MPNKKVYDETEPKAFSSSDVFIEGQTEAKGIIARCPTCGKYMRPAEVFHVPAAKDEHDSYVRWKCTEKCNGGLLTKLDN